MAVFLGDRPTVGKSLEQTKFKRASETRLVWMMAESTNKTRGFIKHEIHRWPLSLLCENSLFASTKWS